MMTLTRSVMNTQWPWMLVLCLMGYPLALPRLWAQVGPPSPPRPGPPPPLGKRPRPPPPALEARTIAERIERLQAELEEQCSLTVPVKQR